MKDRLNEEAKQVYNMARDKWERAATENTRKKF